MPRLDWMFRGRRYEWHVVGGLVVLTIGLGVHGFWSFLASVGDYRSLLHVLYLTAQLFTMNSGAIPAPIPWSLELARILAPSLAAYTALRALLSVFAEQLLLYRLQWLQRHTVICGLGDKGWRLALACRERGNEVVVIELDPQNRRLASAREADLHVIVGDARDREMLRLAGVGRAARLIAVCADDGVNAEIAGKARQVCADDANPLLDCFAHVGNLELYGLLEERELAEANGDHFRLDFFNVVERAAHVLLPLPFVQGARRLLLCGWSPLTEALLLSLAHSARLRQADSPTPHVTLLDADAETQLAVFQARHPGVFDHCELHALTLSPDQPEFYGGTFLFADDGSCRFDSVLVLHADEAAAVEVGLSLAHQLRPLGVIIRIATLGNQGVGSLFVAGNDTLQTVPLLDRACDLDSVLGGTREQLARAVHERYLQQRTAAGDTPQTNTSLCPWSELPEHLRESNRSQAGHLGVKLRQVGMSLAPLTARRTPPDKFTDDEVERLAELEHERWVEERKASGWTQGKVKDTAAKITPYLVPWDDPSLDESVKDIDRSAVRELPSILADAGFRMVRPRPSRG